MFMLKQAICYPGSKEKPNEDTIGYGDDYFFVMDGASCLLGNNIIDPVSDSAWMVRSIKDGLCLRFDNKDSRPIKEILKEVVAEVRKEYVDALSLKGILAPDDSPSAGIVIFRERNDNLEYFSAGDCVGVYTLADGTGVFHQDGTVPALDDTVLSEMARLHKETGVSMMEAKALCNDLLVSNRLLRNKPGGYWILDLLSDGGIEHGFEMVIPFTHPVSAAAFSDGFAQLTEVFGEYSDYIEMFDAMRCSDLEEMYRMLCKLQDEDPLLCNFPRFKHRDDACAVWGMFSPGTSI